MLLGRATPEATERYAARHGALKHTSFFRKAQDRTLSTLGLGTYLGATTPEANQAYVDAIVAAVRGGINVLDTSLNYRNQRSEQAIGQAIIKLTQQPHKAVDRDELLVCTKAGYLVRGATPEGLAAEDVVGGMHSMAPAFLSDQLERSRVNLGLETIDVFYLHNPETQFGFIGQEEFYAKVKAAFLFLEEAVQKQKIQHYGAATWEGFRKPHALSLSRMETIAREIAGESHHFRFVQLPLNLAMPEAYTSRHQSLGEEQRSLVEVAGILGITVIASASMLQSKLAKNLPEDLARALPGLETDAQRAIQFTRSTPGITTALAGMGRTEHVHENLGIAHVSPLNSEQYREIFQARA